MWDRCRLCEEEAQLRKSHIIPEFVHKPTYDEKHRAILPDYETPKIPVIQKGAREPLLCDGCENRVGRLEQYFADIWYRQMLLPQSAACSHFEIDNLDYTRFQLFHLSILWRASVAKSKPFDKTSLGPHEKRIREALLTTKSFSQGTYPIFGFALRDPETKDVCHGMIMPPSAGRIEGVRAYCVVFAGCAWYYFVDRQPPPLPQTLMLSESGTIVLPVIDFTDFPLLVNLIFARKRLERLASSRKRSP